MKIYFSDLETGICPSCKKIKDCHIHKNMINSILNDINTENGKIMEIVIYVCPEFKENNET